MHHNGDVLHPVPLRRGREAVHGSGGIPGFQPRAAGVAVHQLVGVAQLKGPVPDAVHPDGGEVLDHVMPDQLPGHEGHVVGAGVVVAVVKQAAAVGEVAVLHAQLLRPLVHPVHKQALAAAEMLRHGHGAVVGRDHGDALKHIADAHLLPRLQIHAAAAEGGGPLAGGDRVTKPGFAAFNVLHDQQHGHHLGDAGGEKPLMTVFFINQLPRFLLHQHRRGRGDGHIIVLQPGLGTGGNGKRRQAQRKQYSNGKQLFHRPLPVWFLI